MVRKGFDQMLLGWARFIEEAKPRKVRLHLHTTPIGPLGWNLPRLISELGIRNYVTFTGSQQVELADDSYMNGLYNACDVLLNTSMAEGFCLPLLEACACSKPLVYTDYAGPSTVFQGCGIPIKPGSYIIWNSTESRFAVAGEKNVATAIKDMYNHIKEETKQLEEYRVAARQIAELLNTDVIAQQWLALINSIGKKGIKYIKDPL
jgi:glycosyltransferase involved in cell wall biosynthesis